MKKIKITRHSDKKSGYVDLPGGGQSNFTNDDELRGVLNGQKREYQRVVDDIDKHLADLGK